MNFLPAQAFVDRGYRLLPLRFRRLPWDRGRVFVSSMAGDWITLDMRDLERAIDGTLRTDEPLYATLQARQLLMADENAVLAPLLSQYRSRKAPLQSGPALHLFVTTLRCHHSCAYCQVSRRETGESAFDMREDTAQRAVERLFEWPSRTLTVEFQGGEPLLHFDRVRGIVEAIERRNANEGRRIRFVLASTLHDLTDDQLGFLRDHAFRLSTSLDGPAWLHDANRPRNGRHSHRRTLEGIERGRRALGEDAVSALTTLTARSLQFPVEIVDEYRRLGFRSIFLRPLSPYGFALRNHARQGYPVADFLRFYATALDRILAVNRDGYAMDEVYASLLLSQLATPFSHGYVDLRSPTGAGFGAIVYDYDGGVYPSDEARMLAAMGDRSFALGTVDEPVASWLRSPAFRRIVEAGVAEALPQCADCAYVPLCGADPVDHYARQGDPVGHRPSSEFCARQMGLFDLLLERWERADREDRSILERWALQASAPHEANAERAAHDTEAYA